MTNLNPNQFGRSPVFHIGPDGNPVRTADMAIADMQAQIEGARASFGDPVPAGRGRGFAEHQAAIRERDERQRLSEATPGFYRKDDPGWKSGSMHANYEYQVPNERHPDYRGHLMMMVEHTKASASYDYGARPEDQDLTPAQAGHMARAHSWIAPARKDGLEAIGRGEPKLFGHGYTPGRSEVAAMFGTKRGSAHAGTMLGIAARDTAIEHGRTLTPPDDLSPYSSRLVRNLKGKGVVDADAPTTITNDYEHYEEPEHTRVGEDYRISDADVAAGRSTMRSVLRAGRPRKQRETYTQERLL